MSYARLTVLSLLPTILVCLYFYPNLRNLDALGSFIAALRNSFSIKNFSSGTGPQFGLKISFILASFYAANGLTGLIRNRPFATKLRRSKSKSYVDNSGFMNRIQIPFHFMEIPILLSLIVFGSVLIPARTILTYTKVLAGFAPVMPIIEVFSLLTVVMTAGRSWAPRITESHDFVKLFVVLACFASFLASSSIFYLIYAHFRLSTLASSLISSIFTLQIVQIISCCQVDQATLTDPALIFPYIAYNLGLIAVKSGLKAVLDHHKDPQILPKSPQNFLHIVQFFFSTRPNPTITRQILQTIFSPVLVFHLILQLALITVASDESESSSVEDDESDDDDNIISRFSKKTQKLFCSRLWPLFGKSFLVIVYTISWIDQCHPETLNIFTSSKSSILLDSNGFWRWIAISIALTLYGKHLIFDGPSCRGDAKNTSSYTCDKAFWRQFHNLKDD